MRRTIQTISQIEGLDLFDELKKVGRSGQSGIRQTRNCLAFVLMLDAGLRVSEVVQLVVSDIYLHPEPVHTLRVPERTAKYKSGRLVPLTIRIRQVIQELAKKHGGKWITIPQGFVFPGDVFGRHKTTRSIQLMIKSASRIRLNREITPHMLRHSFATELMRTTNSVIVQKLLGHKRLTSTQIYCHPSDKDLKKAIDTLNDA